MAPNAPVVINARVTHDDGLDKIAGGSLLLSNGRPYGTFDLVGLNGVFRITVDWAQLHTLAPITFAGSDARTFTATFTDVAGQVASEQVTLTLVCPAGDAACAGACVSLASENAHCGACGRSCGQGRCTNGTCRCDFGYGLCSSVCIDLQNDVNNCGACGNRLPAGYACVNGARYCGGLDCGNQCLDRYSNEANCGACGRACQSNEACIEGACVACRNGAIPALNCPTGQCIWCGLGTTCDDVRRTAILSQDCAQAGSWTWNVNACRCR